MMNKKFFVVSLLIIGLIIPSFNFMVNADPVITSISENDFFLKEYKEKAGIDTDHVLEVGFTKDVVINVFDISYKLVGNQSDIDIFNDCVDISLVVKDNSFEFVGKVKKWGVYSVDIQPIVKGLTLSDYAWWHSGWSYYKTCNIADKIDDYAMKLVVGNVSGGQVDCESHANSDFSDLRFINLANDTEYPYWIENYTVDVQATLWVTNTDNASTILMYYGNSIADSTSNGSETFLYFDNWTVDNTGDWWSFRETAGGGDDTASNVYNYTGGVGYAKRLRYRYTTDLWVTAAAGATLRIGYCSNEWDITYQYPDDWIGTLVTTTEGDGSTSTKQAWTVYHDVDGAYAGAGYDILDPFDPNAYYIRDFTILAANATSQLYDDNGNRLDIVSETDNGDIPPAADLDDIIMFTYVNQADSYFGYSAVNGSLIVGGKRGTSENVIDMDWIFMSKYQAVEPSWSSFGGETVKPPDVPVTGIDFNVTLANQTDVCPCCISLCYNVSFINTTRCNVTLISNYTGTWIQMQSFEHNANGSYCFTVCDWTRYNFTYYFNFTFNNGVNYSSSDGHYIVTDSLNNCTSTSLGDTMEIYIEISQLVMLMLLGCWLFFTYLFYTQNTKERILAWVQFAFAMPLSFIIGGIVANYTMGYVVAVVIPLLSIVIMVDAYYRK